MVLAYLDFRFCAAFLIQAVRTIVYAVVPCNAAVRYVDSFEKFFILKQLKTV